MYEIVAAIAGALKGHPLDHIKMQTTPKLASGGPSNGLTSPSLKEFVRGPK